MFAYFFPVLLMHSASDFSALISLPPGPHRLKFIVDNEWKASKHLPVATDADGNLINYLQVNPVNSKIPPTVWSPPPSTTPTTTSQPLAVPNAQTAAAVAAAVASIPPSSTPNTVARALGGFNPLFWPFAGAEDDDAAVAGAGQAYDADEDDTQWTQEIPSELIQWGEWEAERDAIEAEWYARYPNPTHDTPQPQFPPPPPSAGVQPPSLPAQLEKGPLNHAAYVTQGSGDDNSILPKPDHSVINHLAASPIKGGYLSVGVTTRYKRKVRRALLWMIRSQCHRLLTCRICVVCARIHSSSLSCVPLPPPSSALLLSLTLTLAGLLQSAIITVEYPAAPALAIPISLASAAVYLRFLPLSPPSPLYRRRLRYFIPLLLCPLSLPFRPVPHFPLDPLSRCAPPLCPVAPLFHLVVLQSRSPRVCLSQAALVRCAHSRESFSLFATSAASRREASRVLRPSAVCALPRSAASCELPSEATAMNTHARQPNGFSVDNLCVLISSRLGGTCPARSPHGGPRGLR